METGYRRCCGIDVHKKSVSVCVLPPAGSKGPMKEEKFRTFTRDLKRLRAWLIACKVTEVAMESTGQYWRPVWNILEGAVPKMLLLNPLHVKGLAGRKTDRLDAQWLATRLEREDLRGSFIPPREVRELRDLTRLRAHWLEDLNRVKNRIGDVCETGNIKVSSVASDLFGVSGRKMLQAVVEGRRDAGWMADYARGRLRDRKGQLELALQGTFSDHQRGHLSSLLKQMQRLEEDVAELEAQIEQRVAVHEDLMRRLDGIPGIDRIAAWTILGEIGFDMGVFEDARHLASWAGVCPGVRESGGKRMSGKTRKGNMYLRRILCQCAWAASHTKASKFAAMYRRIRSRRGHQKAIMAVAHQLLVIVYHLIRDKTVYVEAGEEYLDHRNRLRTAARLIAKLRRLGIDIDPMILSQAAAAIAPVSAVAGPAPTEPQVRRKRGRPCKCAERGIPCSHGRVPSPGNNSAEIPDHEPARTPKSLIQYAVPPREFFVGMGSTGRIHNGKKYCFFDFSHELRQFRIPGLESAVYARYPPLGGTAAYGNHQTNPGRPPQRQPFYGKLVDEYLAEFDPASRREHDLVLQIANCAWRLNRILTMETAALDHRIHQQRADLAAQTADIDEGTRAAVAFFALADNSSP